jgi:S-adenosylmethionine-diacylgycerolhomoserine-N-methlytransferase
VGCGTARNLVVLAQKRSNLHLYGIDASAEMLKTAQASVDGAGLGPRIRLGTALSTDFTAAKLGHDRPFDRLIYSYSLSGAVAERLKAAVC